MQAMTEGVGVNGSKNLYAHNENQALFTPSDTDLKRNHSVIMIAATLIPSSRLVPCLHLATSEY